MSEAHNIINALFEHNHKISDSVFVWKNLKRLQEIFESQEAENERLKTALAEYSDKNNWAKGSLKRFNGKVFNHDLWVGGGHGYELARKVEKGK